MLSFRKNPVYVAHKALGFPKLTDEQQCCILLFNDLSTVYALTPHLSDKPIPDRLLKEYIHVNRHIFKNYIINCGFVEERLNNHTSADGMVISEIENGMFKLEFQERGLIESREVFKNKDELINRLVSYFYERVENG